MKKKAKEGFCFIVVFEICERASVDVDPPFIPNFEILKPPIMEELKYTVYILRCSDGKFYTGYSKNIQARLVQHNKAEVHFTKSRLLVELVHLSLFENKQKAYDFERYPKTGSGIAFRNKRLI